METWATVITLEMERKFDLGIIFKAESRAFADRLDVGIERKIIFSDDV